MGGCRGEKRGIPALGPGTSQAPTPTSTCHLGAEQIYSVVVPLQQPSHLPLICNINLSCLSKLSVMISSRVSQMSYFVSFWMCRAGDFEDTVLTCTRFHQAAQLLILEHILCKKYAERFPLPLQDAGRGPIVLRQPFNCSRLS